MAAYLSYRVQGASIFLDVKKMIEDDYYADKIEEYKAEALRKLTKQITCDLYELEDYASCIATAFFEGCHYATNIFKKFDLKSIDAYAILHQYKDFIQEYDQYQYEMTF